jgi:hypothetical protein
MAPNLLIAAIMTPLIGWLLWRRLRSYFGRQPVRRKRMVTRILGLIAVGALIALNGLHDARLLEGLLGGVAGGVMLGLLGLQLTRFERDAGGADVYIPNPWIGGALSALLLGRLAWRFLVVLPQMNAPAGHGAPAFGNSPLTLLVLGLMIGYYTSYYAGLLVHHRRFERTQPM